MDTNGTKVAFVPFVPFYQKRNIRNIRNNVLCVPFTLKNGTFGTSLYVNIGCSVLFRSGKRG